jgi:hypothetical protein
MQLYEHQMTIGTQQAVNGPRPPFQIVDPAQHSDGCVHHVEAAVQALGRIGGVCLYQVKLDTTPTRQLLAFAQSHR